MNTEKKVSYWITCFTLIMVVVLSGIKFPRLLFFRFAFCWFYSIKQLIGNSTVTQQKTLQQIHPKIRNGGETIRLDTYCVVRTQHLAIQSKAPAHQTHGTMMMMTLVKIQLTHSATSVVIIITYYILLFTLSISLREKTARKTRNEKHK